MHGSPCRPRRTKSWNGFYEAALDSGGKKKSPPDYDTDVHPYYYVAGVADPDGNFIEAVCHGPVKRSADAVVLRPSATKWLKNLF